MITTRSALHTELGPPRRCRETRGRCAAATRQTRRKASGTGEPPVPVFRHDSRNAVRPRPGAARDTRSRELDSSERGCKTREVALKEGGSRDQARLPYRYLSVLRRGTGCPLADRVRAEPGCQACEMGAALAETWAASEKTWRFPSAPVRLLHNPPFVLCDAAQRSRCTGAPLWKQENKTNALKKYRGAP